MTVVYSLLPLLLCFPLPSSRKIFKQMFQYVFLLFCFSNDTPQLYTVLPEKRTDRVGQAMMGSTHVYDVAAASSSQKSNPVYLLNRETFLENWIIAKHLV